MQKLNQQYFQSVVKLPQSICLKHKLPFEIYCSNESCSENIRVCQKCKDSHKQHHQKYFTETKKVIQDLTNGLKRSFDKMSEYVQRVKQLSKLMNQVQSYTKEEYEILELELVKHMKQDKTSFQTKIHKLQEIYSKIEEKQRIKTYFAKLQKHNLVQLKIKLSNEKGMLTFRQKNQRFCNAINKSSTDETQKLYKMFSKIVSSIQQELNSNYTFKIGQILALKNSKKKTQTKNVLKKGNGQCQQKENQKTQNKENKQKIKSKTTQNIAEGFISGILNLFNF